MRHPFKVVRSSRGVILRKFKIYELELPISSWDSVIEKITSLKYNEGLTQALGTLEAMKNPSDDMEVLRVFADPKDVAGWMEEIQDQAGDDLVMRWFLSGSRRPETESLVYILTGKARPGFSAGMVVPPKDKDINEYLQIVQDLGLAESVQGWNPASALEKVWALTIQKIQSAL